MAKRKSIEGKNLMLFIDSKTIALATSCSLNVSRNMDEASSKDDGSWRTVTPGDASWDISTDALFSPDKASDSDKQSSFYEAFAAMVEGKELTAVFTLADNASAIGLPEAGWLPASTGGYTGKCYVNSANISAAKGSAASQSISFTGNGPLTPQEA
jgi:hypothetical protein